MQILSLTLEDIKSYARAHIDFTPGTNAIVGRNGAGKSTILEAIGYALFDTLPYKQADFVREGVKTGTVTVRFRSSNDERVYDVVRRCGGSSHYYVFDPETELRALEGKADVVRFLREHLGADPGADLERLFRDAVGVLQGTLTAAFLDVASKRVGTFDPLLQVHDYDTAWTRLREPVRTLREQLQALDVEIAGLQARLEQLPALETAVAARTQAIAAKESQAAQLQTDVAAVQEALAAMDAAAQAVTTRTRAADRATAQIESARERLLHAEQALAEAQEAAALVAAHVAGHAAYEAAQARKRELDAQATARALWAEQRSTLDAMLARAQAELAATDQSLAEVTAAKAELAALTAPAARQQELESALTDARARMAQRDAAVQETARAERELARLTTRRAELVQARQEAPRLEDEQRRTEAAIGSLQTAMEEKLATQEALKAQADVVNKQTAELKDSNQSTCPVCEQPLTAAHRAEMLTRNESRLATMRADYRAAQDALTTAREAQAKTQATLASLVEAQRKLPRAQEIDDVDAALRTQEASLIELRARVATLTAAAEQVAEIEAALQALGNPAQKAAVAQAKAQREAALTTARATQAGTLESTRQEIAQVEQARAQFAELDAQVRATVAALAEHEAAFQVVLSNRRMAETLPAREEAVSTRRAEVAAAETDHADATQALQDARAQYDEQAHVAAKAQEMQQRSTLASLQTELRLLTEQNARDQAAMEQLRAVQSTLAERTATRARTATQADVLEHLRGVLKQAGPYVRRMVIQRISTEAAQIFGDLMQDHSRHLAWSEDYEITLDVNGNARQFAQLSGGEQMSAALSVRLALLRAMSNIDVAFFDEPTSNLDEARRSALAQQITQNHGLRQLFVISHDDTFEQATENLIRVARVNGFSEIEE